MTTDIIAGAAVVDEPAKRDPDLVSARGSRTWSVRGRNFVVAITELAAGDRLTDHDLPDEYLLLVQDDAEVSVQHGGRPVVSVSVSEPALVVVPAGTSSVQAASSTTVTAGVHRPLRRPDEAGRQPRRRGRPAGRAATGVHRGRQ